MELIKGQCEYCGSVYELVADVAKPVAIKCLTCTKVTDNWDTSESQLAPFVVAATS